MRPVQNCQAFQEKKERKNQKKDTHGNLFKP